MGRRHCLACDRLTSTGSYCRGCTAGRDAGRSARRRAAGYSPAERRRRAAAVAAHRAEAGDVCPGWRRQPHPAGDLTADHLLPVAAGGQAGPLRVLCRGCNSARGAGRSQ